MRRWQSENQLWLHADLEESSKRRQTGPKITCQALSPALIPFRKKCQRYNDNCRNGQCSQHVHVGLQPRHSRHEHCKLGLQSSNTQPGISCLMSIHPSNHKLVELLCPFWCHKGCWYLFGTNKISTNEICLSPVNKPPNNDTQPLLRLLCLTWMGEYQPFLMS